MHQTRAMPSRNRYGRPKLASPLPSHTKQRMEASLFSSNKQNATKIEQRQRQQEVKSLILLRLNLLPASPSNMRRPSSSPPRHEEEDVQPLIQRQHVGDHQREAETATHHQLISSFDDEDNPACCGRVGKGYTKNIFTILLWAVVSLAIVNRFFVHMTSDFDNNSLDAINLNLVDPPEDSSLKRH